MDILLLLLSGFCVRPSIESFGTKMCPISINVLNFNGNTVLTTVFKKRVRLQTCSFAFARPARDDFASPQVTVACLSTRCVYKVDGTAHVKFNRFLNVLKDFGLRL